MAKIFEPTSINGMALKNRLIRSATWENMADDKGHMTDKLFKVYEELAKGGVGMILTGYAFVVEEEQPNPGMMGIYDDTFIAEYQQLTTMVHQHDSRIVAQIAYGGSQTGYPAEGRLIWGPSAVADLATAVVPTEMTQDDITTLVHAFGAAAKRAKAAGFDGVQMHGAHGYLLSQFLSPYYNRRSDQYGGSIENRARILIEVYEQIRKQVGDDYPVMIKINAEDYFEQGLVFDDCRYVCHQLAQRGIDAIEITGGTFASGDKIPARAKINTSEKEAYHAQYAIQLADELDIPIITVGGLRSPEVIELLLETSRVALFSLSRPLLSEPNLPNRWQSGDRQRAKCVSCNGCLQNRPGGNVCILNLKKGN
ncbi:MAG: oxidoreductase [Desulfuromonadales bacterium C00003068]|nr:MAG: oxidoreductase [Desulfuromonadales bacterium C00003068]